MTVRGLQIFFTIITKYAVKVFHILLLKALAVSTGKIDKSEFF